MKFIFKKIFLFLAIVGNYEIAHAKRLDNIPLHATIITVDDLNNIIPASSYDVSIWSDTVITTSEKQLDNLLAIPAHKRTFANTIKAYDTLTHELESSGNFFSIIAKIHDHKGIRNKSSNAASSLHELHEKVSHHEQVYEAFIDYQNHQGSSETLTDEERYFLTSSLNTFKQQGLHLPTKIIKQLKAHKRNIADQAHSSPNITPTRHTFWFSQHELRGVDESFYQDAPVKNGQYKLIINPQDFEDTILYTSILETCIVESTRKNVYETCYHHQASKTDECLQCYINQQNEYAQLLGYQNFAYLDLETTMAKTPENTTLFLKDMITACVKKGQQELELLKKNLPKSVSLNAHGTIDPWNYAYVRQLYKKKQFSAASIEDYLPINSVLDGMFNIFGNFFNLTFTTIATAWTWHEDIITVAIHDKKTGETLGYLYLDLFKRDEQKALSCDCYTALFHKNKPYTCNVGIINTQFDTDDTMNQCINYTNLITLFHEFGHALHDLLAQPSIANHQSIIHTKTDFLEMPSQMFERWCFEPSVLVSISRHYKTGKQLTSTMAEQMLQAKAYDGWQETLNICLRSLFCITLFEGVQNDKEPYEVWQELQQQMIKPECLHISLFWYYSVHDFLYDPTYNAKFYSYPWSEVHACDVFQKIKSQGLTQASTGNNVRNKLLAPGAGVDPETLLAGFLGRQPANKAFKQAMLLA